MEPIIGLKKETTVTIKSNQAAELREITTEIQSFPRDRDGVYCIYVLNCVFLFIFIYEWSWHARTDDLIKTI